MPFPPHCTKQKWKAKVFPDAGCPQDVKILPLEKQGHYWKLSWENNQREEPGSHTKKLMCKGTKSGQEGGGDSTLGHHAGEPDVNKPSELFSMLSAFVLWGEQEWKADVTGWEEIAAELGMKESVWRLAPFALGSNVRKSEMGN